MVGGTVIETAHILVVDDEQANVRLFERLLEQAGYHNVRSTTDSRAVLGLVEEFLPDLIILDLHMPDIGGLELMQQIGGAQGNRSYLPILIVTADANPETKLQALLAGARDFLTKPIDRVEVMLRIRLLLQTRFAFRELEQENALLREQLGR